MIGQQDSTLSEVNWQLVIDCQDSAFVQVDEEELKEEFSDQDNVRSRRFDCADRDMNEGVPVLTEQ